MTAIKEHLAHHSRHVFACGVTGLIMITGFVLSIPALAIAGAVGCAASCASMIWMMFAAARSH